MSTSAQNQPGSEPHRVSRVAIDLTDGARLKDLLPAVSEMLGRLGLPHLVEVCDPPRFTAATIDTSKDRRERIATALLAGLYANPGHWNTATLGSPILAAVQSADQLLAELDRQAPRYSSDGYVHLALPQGATESDLRAAWAAHEERMRQQSAGKVPR